MPSLAASSASVAPPVSPARSEPTPADMNDGRAPSRSPGEATPISGSPIGPVIKPLPRHNEKSAVGTNLTTMKDYMSEWPFVDVFKKSREWISGGAAAPGASHGAWATQDPLDLDEHGWVRSLRPGQIARTLLFWNETQKIQYPRGDYVVLYDGKGRLEYVNADVIESRPGRQVVRADPQRGGIGLFLTATDPKDYLRNIRIIMPGGSCSNDGYKACASAAACGVGGQCVPFEQTYAEQIFHPTFLDRIKTYSTLRFMDWMATNGSAQRDWMDRPKVDDARWTVKGVPLEILADLANRISADAWVNVPHLATPEYVTEMAKLLAKTLDPQRRVYVESSNEVWNLGFPQAKHAREDGLARQLGATAFDAGVHWHARRSVEVFRAFEAVFPRERLRRVMGAFIADSRMSKTLLDFEKAYEHTDALALNVYFGANMGSAEKQVRARMMTLDEVFEEIHAREVAKLAGWIGEHVAIAKSHGLQVYAYEGGEHFAGVGPMQRDPALNKLFDAVGRDPRIKGAYREVLGAWKDKGGTLFMHFVNCAQPGFFGRFGALEQLEQARETAPKFDALQTFIETNPRWW